MKSWSSREVLKILKADGWTEKRTVGSHVQLIHSSKSGKVTVPHPKKDIPHGTVVSIFKQAGISPEDL